MILLIFGVVILRYFFGGLDMAARNYSLMHALFFYLLPHMRFCKTYVRVDVFYRKWSKKNQAWVNLLGAILFLCPFSLFYSSLDYVTTSWSISEASRDAGGLPYPFISLLQSTIIVTALLLLQGLAMTYKSTKLKMIESVLLFFS